MWNPALSSLAWFQRKLKILWDHSNHRLTSPFCEWDHHFGNILIIANITSVSIVIFVTFLATLKMVLTLVRASVLPFEECVAALHWSNVSNRSSAALGETLLGRWRRGNVWSKWEWGGLFDDHRDKKWSTGVLKVWFLQKNIYLAASPPAHPKSFSGGN